MILSRSNGQQIEVMTDKGLAHACLQIFKANAPYRTGTLRGQVRVEFVKNGFHIVSDIYYMPYTTEKWGYHRGWKKTLVNPNEGWWQEAFEMCIRMISTLTGREFKRES